ncbi:cobalt ECF transporter T component CbiQ [Phycicoccus endophyticus]|uniref:cobalt ECF transporter T component CbiQ n=1 Tax=Phycicoccus endophyticus TaxID=1690220 RepID=UPI001CB6E7B8|nr:cobalt ECF transporter T component CbiQ [Phycicoccus endophyticus]
MARLAVDDAAWASRWRSRSTEEKALLALGLLLIAVTTGSAPVVTAVALLAVGCALAGARVPWRTYLRVLLAPAAFVLLGAASVAVTVGDGSTGAVWSAGPVAVTDETLGRALHVLGRSLAATSAMALLATTTPVVDLVAGLRRLRVPDAVVDVAELTYRMLFLLLDTAATVREAQAARLGYSGGPPPGAPSGCSGRSSSSARRGGRDGWRPGSPVVARAGRCAPSPRRGRCRGRSSRSR